MAEGAPSWDSVASRYGLVLKLQGGQLRGPCPLHGGTNPTSLAVDPARGLFYCHACGQGGGVTTFIQLMESGEGEPGAPPPHAGPRRRAYTPGRLGLERLAEERLRVLEGLPDVDPVCPRDPKHPYYRIRGISPEAVTAIGGGVYRGPGIFHHRAIFPVWTPAGRLVGHVGRAIDPDVMPRYVCERGFRRSVLLYNEAAFDPMTTMADVTGSGRGTVVVVEGPFDVLAVLDAGVPNVVALLGCMASDAQLAALSGYAHVIALLDADDAGRNGARFLQRVVGQKVRIVDLGQGDPATVGRGRLASLLSGVVTGRTRPGASRSIQTTSPR